MTIFPGPRSAARFTKASRTGRICRGRARARRTWWSCCSTTSASPISAATARRSRRRTSTARGQRPALHQLPHHRAVLADARGAADRPQPSLGRHARARQLEHRLSELHRHGDEERRHHRRDAAADRLLHLRRRQVAPDADGADLARRPVRPVAAGARVRPLLRLPRGRDRPVASGPHLRQPSDQAAEDAGAGLSPERGPGRPGDRHGARQKVAVAGKAVLPLSRVRRHACAASGAEGISRQVSRQVRRRLGCGAPAVVRAAEAARHHSAGHRACAAQSRRRAVGSN